MGVAPYRLPQQTPRRCEIQLQFLRTWITMNVFLIASLLGNWLRTKKKDLDVKKVVNYICCMCSTAYKGIQFGT